MNQNKLLDDAALPYVTDDAALELFDATMLPAMTGVVVSSPVNWSTPQATPPENAIVSETVIVPEPGVAPHVAAHASTSPLGVLPAMPSFFRAHVKPRPLTVLTVKSCEPVPSKPPTDSSSSEFAVGLILAVVKPLTEALAALLLMSEVAARAIEQPN